MPPKHSFRDKVVIVTGGASGIGRAVCNELRRMGAILTLADIDIALAEKAAAEITQAGGKARALRMDVTCADEVQKLITETAGEHGRLDYMFNNAGIAIIGEVRDMTLENWRKIVDVNLWGVIYGAMAAYPIMIEQGFGHIVNIASVAGLVGIPMFASYCTTKHAVVGFSTALRHEAVGLGVNVTTVCPGFIRTELFENSQLLNLEREGATSQAEAMSIKVDAAALKIIRGVEKNKAIVNFPFSARVIWLLNRLSPALLSPVMSKAVKDFRANRVES